MGKYSQWKAFLALTKAALQSISKSPSSVIFTIAFPLVFILAFGFIGHENSQNINLSIDSQSDTNNYLYQSLVQDDLITIKSTDSQNLNEYLSKGIIDCNLIINNDSNRINVIITSNKARADKIYSLENKLMIYALSNNQDLKTNLDKQITISQNQLETKNFTSIDFILPGQLGFSLLAASVFGTAFVFFSLRQSLVLKRFFATPIRKYNILLSEGVSRMVFQILGAILLIFVGYFFLGFTLINGWSTFFSLLLLCAIGVMVFMSFGFVISGIANSESTIPPIANIFTLPQFILAGTFFEISILPKWLQYIANLMPLTHLNNALRNVAFDGAGLWETKWELLILLIWGIVGYFLAAKTFKWE